MPSGNSKGRAYSPAAPYTSSPVYPFTALVGQEELKLSLILLAIDPMIGGVLIMGHRGTAKSTAVRALADVLPPIIKVEGCRYSCDPDNPAEWCSECTSRRKGKRTLPRETAPVRVVDLPLGATEDRVCGSLDIERALRDSVVAFEPGLLARANRGFLYVDEVNLLEDHLVDLLLDVAASGRNVVEREGVSVGHPARFALVGSGNPDEGELRPQLLDRFGLYVNVNSILDVEARVEIVMRRERFEKDRAAFDAEFAPQQDQLRRQIERARQAARNVSIERDTLLRIADLCYQTGSDGHRGELAIVRASRALAALEGREVVTSPDVRRVATMCLCHRLRKDALGEVDAGGRIRVAVERVFGEHCAGRGLQGNGTYRMAAVGSRSVPSA
jgi:magnesium chelatase subunit I